MDTVIIYKTIEAFIVVLVLLLLLASLALYIIAKYRSKSVVQIFRKGEGFDKSIQRFSQMSDRAQATFMHRFSDSLNENQLMLMRKYTEKHLIKYSK